MVQRTIAACLRLPFIMSLVKKEFAPCMVLIPEGTFLMGCDDGQDNEKPVHGVWIDSFLIGQYPVTNRDFRIFVEETGAPVPPFCSQDPFSHPDKPVVGVSWYDGVVYCEWLSRRSGKAYRFPTEAEWERAARGGKEGNRYPWGNEAPWEKPFLGYDADRGGPRCVGGEDANDFGLYDMSGGVHEWCSDYYDSAYYKKSPEQNPQGPASGARRVSRGGSWRHRIKFSRCAARSSLNPSFRYADYGFRVAMSLCAS